MQISLLCSPKRKSLIFILPAAKCSALIYLFAAIHPHKMVPMVRLLIYPSIRFILPIITLICVTLAFQFSFWVSHSAHLSTGFRPTSFHFSMAISMGVEIPYFPTGKKKKKKLNADSKEYEDPFWDTASLPTLERLHPGSGCLLSFVFLCCCSSDLPLPCLYL